MHGQIIVPFLESAQQVLQMMTTVALTPGTVATAAPDLHTHHVWIRIDLKGDVDGQVAFGLAPEMALKIASAMMGGFELSQFDEMSQSAVAELANMISGNACMQLSNNGMAIDITPPQVQMGETLVQPMQEIAYMVPLELQELGILEIKLLIA
ncbi:chemotaxis protein CheX [Tumebacillus sp. BK434]|uniref:chemotaxis protein CheX n=1 Tax=Tumebacillus sp. BK434 TaxID=2512169 RepID=UPI00104852C3|nr:chemotaxis protein CheX [Tumebacillus sp. BK434]TCP54738.1 chemotaxis protein CheX [Tumebacillus sp. BK434]